jgi:hypothetical protein
VSRESSMSPRAAFYFGACVTALACALVALSVFINFVSSDLDGFRRWIDRDLSKGLEP